MTEDIIRVKSASYARFEELLLKRDKLRKEAFQYQQSYVREFGELIIEVFNLKIECIRRKKTIEFCQLAKNHGMAADPAALRKYLEKELAGMMDKFDSMVDEYDKSKVKGFVSESDMLKIRKIYHKLAKRMHPDLNPLIAECEEFKDLWNRIVVAYNCNNLEELEELEFLAISAIEKLGGSAGDIDIPNLHEKIAQLEEDMQTIQETDPYAYKFLLEDPQAVYEKRRELQDELGSYRKYSEELDSVIAGMGIDAGGTSWRMS